VGHAALRVLLALVPAHPTALHTGLKGGARRGTVELGLAREDPAGRQAHVGAIEAELDAAEHLLHVVLTEVSVGVGDASLSAVEASLDALNERIRIHVGLGGVGLGYPRGVRHVVVPPFSIHRFMPLAFS
jgi:hypothetical protein